MTTFAQALREAGDRGRPLVLDGGSGTWLEAAGANVSGNLWSAALLDEDPALVSRMHREFLAAGARVIESIGYQATIRGFVALGYSAPQARELLVSSWRLCADAAREYPDSWAAASLGPYGAFLADGSEYTGNDGLSIEKLAQFHRERIAVLYEAGARLFAAETVPSAREAAALESVMAEYPLAEWWLSFSLREASEPTISDGTPLAEALLAAPGAAGIGVNCCPAPLVPAAVRVISAAGRHAIAYPNAGERYDAASKSWSGAAMGSAPESIVDATRDAGLAMVGGCCRTTPSDTAALARAAGGPT